MRLPFTPDQFLDVFRRYNEAVWPTQWLLIVLAVVGVALALRDEPRANRWVSVLLSALWFWMAVAYHLAFFADLSRIGIAFGVAFALQGALFSSLAVRHRRTLYRPHSGAAMTVGALLILYALVVYPAIGYLGGHRYPSNPTFGVPCPTTIFTLGLIAWASESFPWRLAIIPIAWALVGTGAATNLGVTEDYGLIVAALLAAGTLVAARRGRSVSARRQPAARH